MNHTFQQKVTLIGVVGKKGSGKLDNGQAWETDRVELHCLSDFPESDSMATGQTVVVHRVDNYLVNYEPAKKLVGKDILLNMALVPSKKLGQAPAMRCQGFEPATAAKAS